MLNEIKEFRQYTYPTSEWKSDSTKEIIRLKHKTITKELGGIRRAMTIIARKLYFEDYYDKDPGDKIYYVRENLKAWCGGKVADSDSLKVEKDWLPNYIKSVLGGPKIEEFKKNIEENIEEDKDACEKLEALDKRFLRKLGAKELVNLSEALKRLTNARRRFSREMFSDKESGSKDNKDNDFKGITYERIVADAIAAGPLKRYYLVCETMDFKNIYFATDKNPRSEPFKKEESKWPDHAKKKSDLIMKTVAAVLLEQKFRGAEDPYIGYVPINKTDINNWCSTNSDINDQYKRYFYGGNLVPLFEFNPFNNVTTIQNNEGWMKDCGWSVIPENELEQFCKDHPNSIFFSDQEGEEFLQKNKPYPD